MIFPVISAAAQRAALTGARHAARWTAAKKECAALVVIAILTFAITARADQVRTLDGRVFNGDASIVSPGIKIGDKTVPWKDLLDARWTGPVWTPLSAGVVLTDGTAIAGTPSAVNDRSVTLQRTPAGPVTVPADSVARVQFAAVADDRLARLANGPAGLMLRGGDFFEGPVAGFDGNKITMDSATFGPTEFDRATRADGIFFRASGRLEGDLRVDTADGTSLGAERINPDGDAIRVKSPNGIAVEFSRGSIVQIVRSGPGVVDAADLNPLSIDGGPAGKVFSVDRGLAGLPARVVGVPGRRVICVAGGSVTFAVPEGCDYFACRAAAPAGMVPSSAVRLTVDVDQTEAARADRFSVDDPEPVLVPVAGRRSVKLSVGGGAPGLWIDPVFVRHVDRPAPPATRPTTGPDHGAAKTNSQTRIELLPVAR
jgi:hypothetical protein